MKKFIKKNAFFLSALVIMIILIVIIIVSYRPVVNYKLSKEQMISLLKDRSQYVLATELDSLIGQNSGKMIIVDVRTYEEFNKGHIKDAINIPVLNLLDKKVLSFFKDINDSGQEIIICGSDQQHANGPWLLLKQVGVQNVKVLQGGYQFYRYSSMNDSLAINEQLSGVEKSILDTASMRKTITAPTLPVLVKPKVKKEKIIPVKQEESIGGGC